MTYKLENQFPNRQPLDPESLTLWVKQCLLIDPLLCFQSCILIQNQDVSKSDVISNEFNNSPDNHCCTIITILAQSLLPFLCWDGRPVFVRYDKSWFLLNALKFREQEMASVLIKFILVTEVQKYFLRSFKRELEVHKVVQELREAIEDYILCKWLLNLHCLLLLL